MINVLIIVVNCVCVYCHVRTAGEYLSFFLHLNSSYFHINKTKRKTVVCLNKYYLVYSTFYTKGQKTYKMTMKTKSSSKQEGIRDRDESACCYDVIVSTSGEHAHWPWLLHSENHS